MPPSPQLLQRVLAHWRLDLPAVALAPIAGGLSAARVWSVRGPQATWCLRRHPQNVAEEQIGWRCRWVEHLRGGGCELLPRYQMSRQGTPAIRAEGHLWELTSWIPGSPLEVPLKDPAPLRLALQALAELHRASEAFAVTAARGAGAREELPWGVQLRLAGLREFARDPHLWYARLAHLPQPLEEFRTLADAFLRLAARAAGPVLEALSAAAVPGLPTLMCLRDLHREHVLFLPATSCPPPPAGAAQRTIPRPQPNPNRHLPLSSNRNLSLSSSDIAARQGEAVRVSGMIDLGAARVDTPVADICRLLGSLAGDNKQLRQLGLDAYRAQRALSVEELRLLAPFEHASTLLSGIQWIRWLVDERRSFSDPTQVLARFREILQRMQAAAGSEGLPTWQPADSRKRNASE